MFIYKNNRFTISTYTLTKVFLLLHLATVPYIAQAQWSQTLGWGGAGYGKRSHSSLTSSVIQADRNTCSPNPVVLQIIKRLIESESKRLQDCRNRAKDQHAERQTVYENFLSK